MTKREERDAAEWEGRFAAIEKEAGAILEKEGKHSVRGIYFVLESDAHMARMVEAERRLAKGETTSHVRWLEKAAT